MHHRLIVSRETHYDGSLSPARGKLAPIFLPVSIMDFHLRRDSSVIRMYLGPRGSASRKLRDLTHEVKNTDQ